MKRISSFTSKLMESVNSSSLPKHFNIGLHDLPDIKQTVNRNALSSFLNNFEEKYIEEYSPLNLALYTSSIPENHINHSYDILFFILLLLYLNKYINLYSQNDLQNNKIKFDLVKCFISILVFVFTKNVESVF
jgi:hypothetical protein